jgi:predicted ferric reductase
MRNPEAEKPVVSRRAAQPQMQTQSRTTPVAARGGRAATPESITIPVWVDVLLFVVVVGISLVSLVYTLASGVMSQSLVGDSQWSWHLVRSAGMVSYTLLAASTLWGIFLTTRVLKNWSPSPVMLLLHAATSWLAVVLAAAHALLLMFDGYYTYTLSDLIIPFIGPYRPLAVGLGVIAFWLIFAITISFALRKFMSNRAWKWLHYTSYAAFGLITFHALLAGTDAVQTGVRVILFSFLGGVAVLMVWRIQQAGAAATAKKATPTAAARR